MKLELLYMPAPPWIALDIASPEESSWQVSHLYRKNAYQTRGKASTAGERLKLLSLCLRQIDLRGQSHSVLSWKHKCSQRITEVPEFQVHYIRMAFCREAPYTGFGTSMNSASMPNFSAKCSPKARIPSLSVA